MTAAAGAWPRVAVVGPGGVGAYFGGMLARAGANVTMLGRAGPPSPHLAAMARHGLRINAVTFDERVEVATASEAAVVASAELVLFCVKTVDTDAAARRLAPRLGDGAIVVSLQNGVDNAARMRAHGVDPLAAAVYVAAQVEAPGEVTHRGRGDLVIGHPDKQRAGDVERAAAWLRRAGIGCRVAADIARELWSKLTVNAMANAVSALTGATYGGVIGFAPTLETTGDVAREAVAVARADGHEFDEAEAIEQGLAVCRSVAAATSSTEQDVSAGRPTEIDALNGYIARRGAELGVATPVNRTLWALVKLREAIRDAVA